MLFLSGTRDAFAQLPLLEDAVAKLPQATLHLIEGASHDFAVKGRKPGEIIDELVLCTAEFLQLGR
jgi:pimeloyl-ACP methyl ester carboxylesterase